MPIEMGSVLMAFVYREPHSAGIKAVEVIQKCAVARTEYVRI